jgi:L-threonylcarbamoyladenylate synthase
VAAPSANRSGRPSPTTFDDAVEETGFAAAVALDGGPCRVGLESTVVAALEGELRLLRPGGVTRAQIERSPVRWPPRRRTTPGARQGV